MLVEHLQAPQSQGIAEVSSELSSCSDGVATLTVPPISVTQGWVVVRACSCPLRKETFSSRLRSPRLFFRGRWLLLGLFASIYAKFLNLLQAPELNRNSIYKSCQVLVVGADAETLVAGS